MAENILCLLVAYFLMAVAAFIAAEDKFDEDIFDEDPFQVDSFDEQGTRQGKTFSRTCGSTTKVNNTYFISPGYPAAYPGGKACTIIIKRCNKTIRQLRIDLLDLVLAQPDGDGLCTTDALTITGGNTWVPTLCGDNTALTVYMDFNGNAGIRISVSARLAATFVRRWNIRLIQLGCGVVRD